VEQRLYTTPAFQLASAGLVTTHDDRWTLRAPLPAPVAARWRSGAPAPASPSPRWPGQGADAVALLRALVACVDPAEPDLGAALRPGASPEAIAAVQGWLPCPLPADLAALHAVHDGADPDAALLLDHAWLPLADARAHRAQLLQLDRAEGTALVSPADLPFLNDGGSYYLVRCDAPGGPVFHLRPGEVVQAYDGVRGLLAALVDCFAEGAARVEAGELVLDAPRVAAIKLRHNPCRARNGLARVAAP
jgi:hypothetical protein